MKTSEMLSSHPHPSEHQQAMVACIDACLACVQCCTSCADACLAEEDPKAMASCIRSNMDCVDVCAALARVLSRQTESTVTLQKALIEACILSCETCGEICRSHGSMHDHCKICGDTCAICEKACEKLLSAMR